MRRNMAGYCEMSLARGYLSDGKPKIYAISKMKLYLFYSAANREAFLLAKDAAVSEAAAKLGPAQGDLVGPPHPSRGRDGRRAVETNRCGKPLGRCRAAAIFPQTDSFSGDLAMADIIELSATDLAAMLCSRVCHDLINPVGAIGNGLEVLADPTQAAMFDGAQDLIANSAKHARAKLEFARLAFGASSTAGTDFDTRECERVAKLLFEIEKADLEWLVTPMLLPKHKAKLLMNMLLIAAMAVPRGGVVKVEVEGRRAARCSASPRRAIPRSARRP
jgi:histidine phosphotransferase ChpT